MTNQPLTFLAFLQWVLGDHWRVLELCLLLLAVYVVLIDAGAWFVRVVLAFKEQNPSCARCRTGSHPKQCDGEDCEECAPW